MQDSHDAVIADPFAMLIDRKLCCMRSNSRAVSAHSPAACAGRWTKPLIPKT